MRGAMVVHLQTFVTCWMRHMLSHTHMHIHIKINRQGSIWSDRLGQAVRTSFHYVFMLRIMGLSFSCKRLHVSLCVCVSVCLIGSNV